MLLTFLETSYSIFCSNSINNLDLYILDFQYKIAWNDAIMIYGHNLEYY